MKVNVVASVNIWEKITRSLRTLRLDTMRGKFVAFAVLATLFTTLVMTLMLYGRNRRSLSDRIGQELRGASSDVQHQRHEDRKSTRLNSSHQIISYAVFCLKKKKTKTLIKYTTINKSV